MPDTCHCGNDALKVETRGDVSSVHCSKCGCGFCSLEGNPTPMPATLCPICHHYHGPEPGACWADGEDA